MPFWWLLMLDWWFALLSPLTVIRKDHTRCLWFTGGGPPFDCLSCRAWKECKGDAGH